MQYGHFDDENKEYVITNPATPRSWSNYLGSTEYGAIITNNAGGYSFYKSAAQGRFTRLRFNNIPVDQPGRYIYLRDTENGDYWSASWQPVAKDLRTYRTECRHGTAYTSIMSDYEGITTETTYFVPLGKSLECWFIKVSNTGKRHRNLKLFTYLEYANNWNALDDLINLQYTQYILKMNVIDNIIDHGTNINIPAMPHNFEEKDQGRHTFFALAGAEIKGFDTDREAFLGPYRTYANPLVVESGACTNSIAVGDNGCATLEANIDLAPGETKEIIVLMGIGRAEIEGRKALDEFGNSGAIKQELRKLKEYWQIRLEGMTIESPDPVLNSMMNMWNPFNCLITYAWSRAASLIYAGERDGLGYRDTLQDLLGVMHTIPDEVGERLELMLTGQVSTGGAMPIVKPFAHTPGQEKRPEETAYRSDDSLWLFISVPAYVKESGDIEFYYKILPYADEGEDTVLGHLRKAIEFNLERSGKNGLPCGLSADWNDCLELGHEGESIFVSFQLRYALKTYIEICQLLNDKREEEWAIDQLRILDGKLDDTAWDGNWFLRAFRYDGLKFGSKENDEGQIWLNPQTWSVYSEFASEDQAQKAMQSVKERLSTDYGLMICDPPYEKTDYTVIRATLMNPGMKENASIFCHTQGWAVIAETMMGHGNQAYAYFTSYLPAAFNDKAEIREIESYVYCQSTHSKYSPRYGASRLPWLSGSAAWAYYAANQYILGIQPEYDGLRIDPCIPSAWKEYKVERIFRGRRINIHVTNPDGVEKGVKKVTLNNKEIPGNLILAEQLEKDNEVTVMMG